MKNRPKFGKYGQEIIVKMTNFKKFGTKWSILKIKLQDLGQFLNLSQENYNNKNCLLSQGWLVETDSVLNEKMVTQHTDLAVQFI